ncbi:MAG: hypothetical protein U1C48_07960 [Methylotenera sp.]|nr:hypothetical protein [Methylotenera sp.]
MSKLLSQTCSVDSLLSLILEAIEHIQNDNLKNRMKVAVDIYKQAITPSTIYLSEVMDLAKVNNINLTKQNAFDILTNAALDIDLNYASKSIEFHFNEFVSSH